MRKRILIFSLLITFAGLIIFSAISTEVYYNSTVKHTEEYLRVYMNMYDGARTPDAEYADELSGTLGGARVTFMRLDGTVIADSDSDIAVTENHINRPEVKDAISAGEGFAVRSSKTLSKNMSYYCIKTDDLLVRIALETASEWSVFGTSLPTIIWYMCIDVLICLAFTYCSTIIVLKPVENLARKAALNGKIETKYEELKPLSDIMNAMNENITAQMKELNEEKELVERATASKNEFIANITHEMNTPLTSIKGFAELLKTADMPQEMRNKAVETILAQSERLTNLIACVINYNEIDNDDLPSYEVNISKITEELIAALKPDIDKGQLTLKTEIDKDVIVISRHERINEILGNLIRNAIRYNKIGGSVEVVVKGGVSPYLIVKDTGIGIADENKEKIFDRFFTVDKSHSGKNGGFGLGLAVVKKLCKRSGWKLAVDSELGLGTTFIIEFIADNSLAENLGNTETR